VETIRITGGEKIKSFENISEYHQHLQMEHTWKTNASEFAEYLAGLEGSLLFRRPEKISLM
jgi:hypothetical protein